MKIKRSPEQEFIDQMTRKLLVDWCDAQIRGGGWVSSPSVYLEYARSKGWLSKTDDRVLSTGFETAARFLKR